MQNTKVKCANCGSEYLLSISTDFEIRELTLIGKCLKCESSLQISFIPFSAQFKKEEKKEQEYPHLDEQVIPPVDLPSDEIKNLIE